MSKPIIWRKIREQIEKSSDEIYTKLAKRRTINILTYCSCLSDQFNLVCLIAFKKLLVRGMPEKK